MHMMKSSVHLERCFAVARETHWPVADYITENRVQSALLAGSEFKTVFSLFFTTSRPHHIYTVQVD